MWPLNEILLIVLEVFPGAYSTEQSSATFLHNTTICWSNPSNWSSFCGTILILIYSGFYWTSIVNFHSLWHEPAPSLEMARLWRNLWTFVSVYWTVRQFLFWKEYDVQDSFIFCWNENCKFTLFHTKMSGFLHAKQLNCSWFNLLMSSKGSNITP